MTPAARTVEDLARSRPELVGLARCVSLTISVDHGFLRRARLRFLPRTTAGLEAELWFSALVEAAGSRSLLLHPEVAEHLRQDLVRRTPELLREIRDFTAAEHAHAPLVVRLYEELLWSGLDAAGDTDQEVARQADLVLRTVSGQDTAEGVADDMGRWVLHYAHRLPRHLLGRDDVWRIQVASCERLGLEPPRDPVGRPEAVTAQARARVQHTMAVGVTARSDGIVLSRPPAGGARVLHAKGTRHRVRIDALSSLTHAPDPVRLEVLEGHSVHLPFTVVQRIGPEGDVRMSLSHPGAALDVAACDFTGTSEEAAHCAVLFADGTIVLHGGDGTETGRLTVERAPGPPGGLALSADGTEVSYVRGGVRYHRPLRPGATTRVDTDDMSATALLDDTGPEPTARAGNGEFTVRATGNGRIIATSTMPSSHWATREIGQAPWQVTSLAVSPDRETVAVVGNDATLLEFASSPGPGVVRRRDTLLRFCADRVFAVAEGGWVVAGSGGPVELSTEDGRAYRVMPGVESALHAPAVPAWGRGCVLVEAPEALLAALPSVKGVDCLAADVTRAADGASDAVARGLSAARHRGLRVVVGLDVSVLGEDVLDASVHWLDRDVDGLRLIGAEHSDPALLEDVRHLLDGYDERMLLCTATLPDTHSEGFHVLPASALISALGFAVRSRSVPGGAFEQSLAQLRSEIETTFPDATARQGRPAEWEWGLELPPALTPAARRLAAAILLSLPGCPVLPGALLLDGAVGAPELRPLLEIRSNHLALTRGDCAVLDVGTPHVLAVARRYGDDAVLCLVNIAQIPTTAVLDPARLAGTVRLQDPLDGSLLALTDATAVPLAMAASSVRWFRMLAQ
jgi:hypothetical protein